MVYQSYKSAKLGPNSRTWGHNLDLNNPAIRRHIQTSLSPAGNPYSYSFHNQYLNRVGLSTNNFVLLEAVLFDVTCLNPPESAVEELNTPENIATHGWTPIPADANAIFKGKPYLHKPGPLLVEDIKFPDDDPLVQKIQEFVQEKLSPAAYNHSMRVFYFATAIIRQQFPTAYSSSALSPSTLALACLLHKIGTTAKNLLLTQLSFENLSSYLVCYLLQAAPEFEGLSPISQTEAIAEAVTRHQDIVPPGSPGKITFLGQILQLATLYDNVGKWPYLISRETRDDVHAKFKRLGWAECFARAIKNEVKRKPWCSSTKMAEDGGYANALEENELMNGYR